MKYAICLALIFMAACSKVEVSTYSAARYVQFEKIYTDTSTYSFVFFPGQQDIEVPLEMRLTGHLLDRPAKINLSVDEEYTTATDAIFTLDQDFMFRAGMPRDTVYLKLKRSGIADGDNTVYKIVLNVVDGSELLTGERLYSQRVVKISNNVSKPDWWTATVTDKLLGVYSDKKYITFINNIYSSDLTGASEGTLRVLAIQFKNFLKAQDPPIMDGSVTMLSTVPVIGS